MCLCHLVFMGQMVLKVFQRASRLHDSRVLEALIRPKDPEKSPSPFLVEAQTSDYYVHFRVSFSDWEFTRSLEPHNHRTLDHSRVKFTLWPFVWPNQQLRPRAYPAKPASVYFGQGWQRFGQLLVDYRLNRELVVGWRGFQTGLV